MQKLLLRRFLEALDKPRWAMLTAVAALVISIIAIWGQCSDRTKYVENEYLRNAAEHQPTLRLLSDPTINRIQFTTDAVKTDTLRDLAQENFDTSRVDTISLHLSVTCSLAVRNEGNALAKVRALVACDALSWGDVIRDEMRDPTASRWEGKTQEKFLEVLPGDTVAFTFDTDVRFIDSTGFILHCLILYENELGNLFDSYVWTKFRQRLPEMRIEGFLDENLPPYLRWEMIPKTPRRWAWPSERSNDAYKTYQLREANDLKESLQRIRRAEALR